MTTFRKLFVITSEPSRGFFESNLKPTFEVPVTNIFWFRTLQFTFEESANKVMIITLNPSQLLEFFKMTKV